MNLREEILRIISSMEYRRHPNEPFGARLADALVTFIRNNPQSVPHKCPVCEGNDWISVDERLPEFNEAVLCRYRPRQPVMEGALYGIFRRQDNPLIRGRDENKFHVSGVVTHWMSLPKPPKTEN